MTAPLIICPSGLLDGPAVETLQASLQDYLKQPTPLIIIDCSALTLIDSRGLGFLVKLQKQVGQARGTLDFCALTEGVRIVLEITGLDQVFSLLESREAALSLRGAICAAA